MTKLKWIRFIKIIEIKLNTGKINWKNVRRKKISYTVKL